MNFPKFLAEFVGTAILILLGDGVVANVILKKNNGYQAGSLFINTAWGLAVFVAALCTGWMGGAHLNPAVTVSLASIGLFDWALVPGYIVSQILGAMLGAMLVYLTYKKQFDEFDEPQNTLLIFSTIPHIRSYIWNMVTEIIGTFVLIFGILALTDSHNKLPSGIGPFFVGLLVWVIGMSLGGPTGYAINPARDLGPRIIYSILPIKGKGPSDWSYSFVPIIAPLIGGVLGAVFYKYLVSLF